VVSLLVDARKAFARTGEATPAADGA
jgi:hypothetical protein